MKNRVLPELVLLLAVVAAAFAGGFRLWAQEPGAAPDATPEETAADPALNIVVGSPVEYLSELENRLESAGGDVAARDKVTAEMQSRAAAAVADVEAVLKRLEEAGVADGRLELVKKIRQVAADGLIEIELRAKCARDLDAANDQKAIARKRRMEAEDEEKALGVELVAVGGREVSSTEVEASKASCASCEQLLANQQAEIQKLKDARTTARNMVAELEKLVAEAKGSAEASESKLTEVRNSSPGTVQEHEALIARDLAKAIFALADARVRHARMSIDVAQLRVEGAANALQEADIRTAIAGKRFDALQKRRSAIELAEEEARLRAEKERLQEQERQLAELAKAAKTGLEKDRVDEERLNAEIENRITQTETEALNHRTDRLSYNEDVVQPRLAAIDEESRILDVHGISPSEVIEKRRKLGEEISGLSDKSKELAAALVKARARLDELKGNQQKTAEVIAKRLEDAKTAREKATTLAAELSPEDRDAALKEWETFLTRLAELLTARGELLAKDIRGQEQLCTHIDGFKQDVDAFATRLKAWMNSLGQRSERITTRIGGLEIPLNPWVVTGIALALLALVFVLLNVVGVRAWERLLATAGEIDKAAIRKSVRTTSVVFLLIAVPAVVVNLLQVPEKTVYVVNKLCFMLLIALSLYILGKFLLRLLYRFSVKHGQPGSLSGPLQALVRIALIIIGVLVVLDTIGVSITPLLTTLGIGSVAVALALQDTLSNFFAGLYVTADKPIRVGDYIKLDEQTEGFVTLISWRSTRILTLANNAIVIPNQKLAQSVILNYSL
ncbi:MAG: mechanosensitive ion channel, partial [Planctomycetota bacterium]|nr:mechanosensitive ion channel [Planctomycetota bacterium]